MVAEIVRRLLEAERILICGHVRPDGDCLGSQLGLYWALRKLGKQVRGLAPGQMIATYRFLPGIEFIDSEEPKDFEPEITVFVDCSSPDRVYEGFTPKGLVINIDHHHTNSRFGELNYIDQSAAAVGEQIFELINLLGVELNGQIASCLYLAVFADTGGFLFSNTTSRTLKIAAELTALGASPSEIADNYQGRRPLEMLLLTAEVLHQLHLELDSALIWAEITQEMYTRHGGEENEPERLVSEMRGIQGVEVAVLIHELKEGGLRASFRSRGRVDVSRMATMIGGGGHVSAAGCYVRGDYQTIRQRLLEVVRTEITRQLNLRVRAR